MVHEAWQNQKLYYKHTQGGAVTHLGNSVSWQDVDKEDGQANIQEYDHTDHDCVRSLGKKNKGIFNSYLTYE